MNRETISYVLLGVGIAGSVVAYVLMGATWFVRRNLRKQGVTDRNELKQRTNKLSGAVAILGGISIVALAACSLLQI